MNIKHVHLSMLQQTQAFISFSKECSTFQPKDDTKIMTFGETIIVDVDGAFWAR